MPLAIILGLVKGQSDRIKVEANQSETPFRHGWKVQFEHATGAAKEIRAADQRNALNAARASGESAHILAITNQGGPFKANVAQAFVPAFRLRWLPGEWLALPYPTPKEFIEHVNEVLADEEDWRQAVQPNDKEHCLLLPEPTFSTRLADTWELATKYGEGNNLACSRRVATFRAQHWKKHTRGHCPPTSYWTDADNRIFDHTGPAHGIAPPERSWKYSYPIPVGFHYDMRHADDKPFTARGVHSERSIGKSGYVNIDTFGHFRDD